MGINELENKVRELRQLQALIAEAEAEADAIKDALKAYMGAREELHAGEYKITWRSVESNRTDYKALCKAFPELVAQYTTKTTTRRFCVN